jgi:transposase
MTSSYLPYDPQQQMLLPHALQEWLPEGHLAYYISDTVDSLDLSAFHARYAGGGSRNQPYHPAMMLKVLVYGYSTGIFSSRKLARKLHEDVAFRVLAAGNYPAHRTNCVFHAKWPPVPRQTGHPVHAKLGHSFHAMADSRSVATRGGEFLL